MTPSKLQSPFDSPLCPLPKDPGFREFVLDDRFDRWWHRKELGWRAYRIPVDRLSYAVLFEKFEGSCGICHRFWKLDGRLLSVDHSHDRDSPDALRGLLCSHDNYLLGKREQQVSCGARVRFTPAQAHYLRKSPAGILLLSLQS